MGNYWKEKAELLRICLWWNFDIQGFVRGWWSEAKELAKDLWRAACCAFAAFIQALNVAIYPLDRLIVSPLWLTFTADAETADRIRQARDICTKDTRNGYPTTPPSEEKS